MQYFATILLVVLCLQGYSSHQAEAVQVQGYNLTFQLAALNLPDQDDLSHPDAFVKLYSYKKANTNNSTPPPAEEDLELTRFGTSDHIYNTENPEWPQVFWFWYEAGTGQKFYFKVKDHDILNIDDDIGVAHINVDDFVNHKGNFYSNLSNGGSLILKRTQPISFKIKAANIPPKDRAWFSTGLSDPYIECYYRKSGASEENLFHTTGVISDTEAPVWEDVIEFSHYQPGKFQTLYFKVYDHDAFSQDDFIGDAIVAVDDLARRRGSTTIELQRSVGRPSLTLQLV